jgi:hypothetical protein
MDFVERAFPSVDCFYYELNSLTFYDFFYFTLGVYTGFPGH